MTNEEWLKKLKKPQANEFTEAFLILYALEHIVECDQYVEDQEEKQRQEKKEKGSFKNGK